MAKVYPTPQYDHKITMTAHNGYSSKLGQKLDTSLDSAFTATLIGLLFIIKFLQQKSTYFLSSLVCSDSEIRVNDIFLLDLTEFARHGISAW